MGQQPNLELGPDDSPRAKAAPGAARRWRQTRPGELTKPSEVPSGASFGVAGPDAGYALKLIGQRRLTLLPGEHRHDVAAALAAIATARAGAVGRAPIGDDVTVAMIVLGLDPETPVDAGALAERPSWLAGLGHDASKLRGIVADIPADILSLTPQALRQRAAAGWAFRG